MPIRLKILRYSCSDSGRFRQRVSRLIQESSTQPGRTPLRMVIAGGGTGGHISPAIAVVERMRGDLEVDPVWIGSSNGFERQAAEEAGIPFYTVRTGKLRRYFALATLIDAVRVPAGVIDAVRLLRRLRPDVVFSTGGFVSTPTVIAARILGIPALTHEQTASLGLATRINARFADVVALSYPGSGTFRTRRNTRVIITGNPVRPSVFGGERCTLKKLFDVKLDRPLLYVTGGAQGAHALNQAVAEALPELTALVSIIHQCGPRTSNGDYLKLVERRQSLSPDCQSRYFPLERVGNELADIYASTALVLGRAGAGTVAELAAVGLPSILVPLPGAEEQVRNARVLADAGAAVLLPQNELNPDRLTEQIACLARNPEKRAAMQAAALSVVPEDPAGKLCDAILDLSKSRAS